MKNNNSDNDNTQSQFKTKNTNNVTSTTSATKTSQVYAPTLEEREITQRKIKQINDAILSKNVVQLRQLAVGPGGLLTSSLRARAWYV